MFSFKRAIPPGPLWGPSAVTRDVWLLHLAVKEVILQKGDETLGIAVLSLFIEVEQATGHVQRNALVFFQPHVKTSPF